MKSTILLLLLPILSAALPAQDDVYLEDVQAAERHLQRGELSRARALFEDILLDHEESEGEPEAPSEVAVIAAQVGLMRIALREGEYATVEGDFDSLGPTGRKLDAARLVLARALLRRGKYERAEVVLSELAKTGGFRPRCMLGELQYERGRREEARQTWQTIVDESRSSSLTDSGSLTWVARSHINLGGRGSIEAASGLLVEAIRLDPDAAEARILYGQLRYEVYGEWSGAASGEKSLLEVLKRNGEVEDALVSLYRIRRSNHMLDPAKTEQFLERALAVNPNSVPALRERAVGLIDDRRFEAGAELLDHALVVNPNDKRCLAQRAAVALLRGDPDASAEFAERARQIDPGFAGVDLAIGDRMVALYRFADAVPYYEAALKVEPERIDALHGLAKAMIYAGQGERARLLLEQAREMQSGYVNPWRNNAIAVQQLLEEEYEVVEDGGFLFFLHRADSEVLRRYLVPFQLEARETLDEKYGHRPERPIRVEVLHTWDDFSVRTIGFRGFTALGACFGPLITLTSPVDADLRQREFMWTATVWHEYTHVLTLELSDSRVPRWLTEGFSVHEEGARNPTWERGMTRDLLDAYHNEEIAPVRLMNRLFRGPRILFGYYQGGLIVDYLSEEHGFDKVVEMLSGYARDWSTEKVFEQTFGYGSRDFDRRFRRWVQEEKLAGLRMVPRYSTRAVERLGRRAAQDAGDVEARLALAWAWIQRGVEVDAAQYLREVLAIDPAQPEAQLILAHLRLRRERLDEARQLFERGFEAGADDFDSRIAYGRLLASSGEPEAAISQWLAAKRCWPDCTEQQNAPELLLAEVYRGMGRSQDAMMELTTYCRRTARAFGPRLELAEFARESGDRQQEARLLEEAVQIDPFDRRVHQWLAEAYLQLGRAADAVLELEVCLAIPPVLDRAWLGKPPEEVPREDSAVYREGQAALCLRISKMLQELGRVDAARDYLERALREHPDGQAAAEARELLAKPR